MPKDNTYGRVTVDIIIIIIIIVLSVSAQILVHPLWSDFPKCTMNATELDSV